jgi:hypothetical protein
LIDWLEENGLEKERENMDVVIPALVTGSFAGLVLGLSHWLLPEMHVVLAYVYGSSWCLGALTVLGLYLGIRWEFLVAAWVIWGIAGVFVAGQYLKDFVDESRKNTRRVKESGSNDVYEKRD